MSVAERCPRGSVQRLKPGGTPYPDGFSTGAPQNLLGFTATLDYFPGKGKYDKVLVRPEFRYDHSTADFFSVPSSLGPTRKYQPTAGLNLVYYF